MQTFIMLTRLAPEAVRSSEALERKAVDAIREKCASVEWKGSYVVLGP